MASNNGTALPNQSCAFDAFDLSPNGYTYASNAAAAALHVPSAIFAMASNAAVIITVATTSSLQRPPNILLSSLAFGDFLVGAIAQPSLIVLHLLQNTGVSCSVYSTAFEVSRWTMLLLVMGSFAQVCVMCCDRYLAVASPMNYRTTVTARKAVKMAVASWLGWFAYALLLRLGPSVIRAALSMLALASFITVCAVSQMATYKAMLRHNNQIATAATADTLMREKKMLVTVRYILGSLLLCTLPQLLIGASNVALGTTQTLLQTAMWPWTKLALCASSSLNPVIYFLRHENMRNAALHLIGRQT